MRRRRYRYAASVGCAQIENISARIHVAWEHFRNGRINFRPGAGFQIVEIEKISDRPRAAGCAGGRVYQSRLDDGIADCMRLIRYLPEIRARQNMVIAENVLRAPAIYDERTQRSTATGNRVRRCIGGRIEGIPAGSP